MIAKGLTPVFGAKVFAIMRKVPADAAANLGCRITAHLRTKGTTRIGVSAAFS